jgi:hypothetical protein
VRSTATPWPITSSFTFQGAFILSRSMNDPRHMRAQLGVLRQLIESVLHDPLQMTIQTLREDLPTGLPDAG